MPIVPKKSSATVTPIGKAAGKRGGRQSSIGYNPETQEENYARGSEGEFRAFKVDGSDYREDRFYVRSVDDRGHGVKMNIRIPQGIDTMMHKAVADLPNYHTMHDLIRDAVMHRLHYIQQRHIIDLDMQTLLDVEALKADDYRQDQIIAGYRDAIKDLDDSLKFVWESGDIGAFREKLSRGSLLVDTMRQPWRTHAGEMLQSWKAKSDERVKKWTADREHEAES